MNAANTLKTDGKGSFSGEVLTKIKRNQVFRGLLVAELVPLLIKPEKKLISLSLSIFGS